MCKMTSIRKRLQLNNIYLSNFRNQFGSLISPMSTSLIRDPQNDSVQKNTTIQDVAIYARLSMATVSRILDKKESVSQELVEKVLKAVQALDYHPNRAARHLRKRVA
jgi:hypothetical protein